MLKQQVFSLVGNWIAATRAFDQVVPKAIASIHLAITRIDLIEMFSDDVTTQRHVGPERTSIVSFASTSLGGVQCQVWAEVEHRSRTMSETRQYVEAGRDVLVLPGAEDSEVA